MGRGPAQRLVLVPGQGWVPLPGPTPPRAGKGEGHLHLEDEERTITVILCFPFIKFTFSSVKKCSNLILLVMPANPPATYY